MRISLGFLNSRLSRSNCVNRSELLKEDEGGLRVLPKRGIFRLGLFQPRESEEALQQGPGDRARPPIRPAREDELFHPEALQFTDGAFQGIPARDDHVRRLARLEAPRPPLVEGKVGSL
jgi:hypothetical protein